MNTLVRLLSCSAIVGFNIGHPALGASHARDIFIKQYDLNHDGKIDRSEFAAARIERFNATDTDHNESLEESEYLVEYVAQLDTELAASSQSEADKTATRQRQLKQTLVRFDALDADHSQHISRNEYSASGTHIFDTHDSDKNDVVTTTEGGIASATPMP